MAASRKSTQKASQKAQSPQGDRRSGRRRPGRPGTVAEAGNGAPCQNGGVAEQEADDELEGVARYTRADILTPEWLWYPWIPRNLYTFVVGQPSGGKSCFLAHMCTRVARCVYMPGEEDVRREVLARVVAAGADERGICWLSASRSWRLPHARDKLIRLMHREGAELLVIDPIDEYFEDSFDEDKNQHVRGLLAALALAAADTHAAILFVRHPGKDPRNLFAGSRAWRSAPRSILHMDLLAEGAERGILRSVRPPYGRRPPSHYYDLAREGDKPPAWRLQGEADQSRGVEMSEVTDRLDRAKIDEGCQLLERLLHGGEEVDCREIYRHAEGLRIKERTMQYAAERKGVLRRAEGFGADYRTYWQLPKK